MRTVAEKARGARRARHRRVRTKILGTSERPRLAVYRSLSHIYAQVIDDTTARTLASASSLQRRDAPGSKTDIARQVGARIGERAMAAGITNVVFDRGGFLYHGRVKALAEGARGAGLRL